MNTLLLDRTAWDLCLDASGNIALASDPYSIAQDVASAVKLFKGELWFDTTKGVPYWQEILGQWPPLPIVKAAIEAAAMTVPGVLTARCVISAFSDRSISGQIQFKTAATTAAADQGTTNLFGVVDSAGSPIVTSDGYYIVAF